MFRPEKRGRAVWTLNSTSGEAQTSSSVHQMRPTIIRAHRVHLGFVVDENFDHVGMAALCCEVKSCGTCVR